jgi:hypothetical protein
MEAVTLPPPGPVLDDTIKKAALNLAALDKREADVRIQKILASSKRDLFPFLDAAHEWHPYFLKVLTELRSDEARRKELTEHYGQAKAAKAASSTTGGLTAAQTTKAEAEKAKEDALRVASAAAKQHTTDPSPALFSLQLAPGVEVPALALDVMKVTAQYAAKFHSTCFLETVARKQRLNNTFRFLLAEDPRHSTFCRLVRAYRALIEADEASTEDRLEKLRVDRFVLELCAEKVAFQQADVARKKAALLTDDELRRRLDWDHFAVVHTFDFKDLGVPKPAAPLPALVAQPTAGNFIAPPTSGSFVSPPGMGGPRPQPVFMSSALLSGTSGDAPRRQAPAVAVVDNYEVVHSAPTRAAITSFVDPATGQKVNAAQLQQHMTSSGSNLQAHAAEKEMERRRQREGNNLADDAEYERNMLRRQQNLERM